MNLRLVAPIDIAGMAVAFPVGIGLALVVGVVLNNALAPKRNPLLLVGGFALVMLAIVLDALACKRRETESRKRSARGIPISIACGILIGISYPVVTKAVAGPSSLGPYAVAFFYTLGTALCAISVNFLFMCKPLTPPVSFSG